MFLNHLQNQAKQKLESLGFTLELFNNNTHFKIRDVVDFYPSTGTWIAQDGTRGKSLSTLVDHLRGVGAQTKDNAYYDSLIAQYEEDR